MMTRDDKKAVRYAVRIGWAPCCDAAWNGEIGPFTGELRRACPVHGTTCSDHVDDARSWLEEFGGDALKFDDDFADEELESSDVEDAFFYGGSFFH